MVNQHPSSVERSAISGQMSHSHNRLCGPCQAMFMTDGMDAVDIDEIGDYVHYSDGSAFIAAARSNRCYICTWTWRGAAQYGLQTIHHTTSRLTVEHEDSCQLEINAYKTNADLAYFTPFTVWATNDGSQPKTTQRTLEISTKSPQSLSQARTWLQECSLKHPECEGWKVDNKLPTRLVHVRKDDSELIAHVCNGSTLPPDTVYLSLSHCWGVVKFLTTTRSNISDFEQSLPMNRLSRTLQDALLVTIELGFEYIWIDSLCIVQDDIGDWAREASLMGEVYKNASCNISASDFASGEEGFLLPQRRLDPTPVIIDEDGGSSGDVRSQDTAVHGVVYQYPWEEIICGSLFSRAWTLQEQLLASRALHFGKDQIFWECKRTLANEVWPKGWKNTAFELPLNLSTQPDMKWQFNFENVNTEDSYTHAFCLKLATDYSRRHITFSSDRLPALAGIASKLENHLNDTYLYGLWVNDLHRGLLFGQLLDWEESQVPSSNPMWHDVPSWSWIALNKRVAWDDLWTPGTMEACKIELVKPFTLRLTGMLLSFCSKEFQQFRLAVAGRDNRRLQSGNQSNGITIRVYADQWFLRKFEDNWSDADHSDVQDGSDSTFVDAFRAAVVAMPILFPESHDTRKQACGSSTLCLLLYAQPGLQHGSYRRVGIAELEIEEGPDANIDVLKAALRAYQEPLQNPWYHETNGDGDFTISVV